MPNSMAARRSFLCKAKSGKHCTLSITAGALARFVGKMENLAG